MALTRKMLKAMNIPDEQAEQIIEAHSETVNALKEERDEFKKKASDYDNAQKELDDLKAAAEKNGKDPFKVKYEALKEEFESYKTDVAAKETKSAKEQAYRALLKSAGVSEKRIESVLKVSDIDNLEIDKDGNIKNADDVSKKIKEEWSDFIVTEKETGADIPTPPANNGGKITKADIYKKDDNGRYVMSTSERQKALTEMMNKNE